MTKYNFQRLLTCAFIVLTIFLSVAQPIKWINAAGTDLERTVGIEGSNGRLGATDAAMGLAGTTTYANIVTILGNIATWLLGLVGLLALLALIWGGITYIVSLGDESRTATAKKTILYAVIGLVVVALAWVIIKVVTKTLGVTT